MPARLLADEDVAVAVCESLWTFGHSVHRVSDMKPHARDTGPDDEDVLTAATADERAVLTCNYRDFKALHEQGVRHFGVVGCPAQLDPSDISRAVHERISAVLEVHGSLFRQCFRVTSADVRGQGTRKRKR